MKKKILVIGSNSFTGNNFVNYCLGKNYNIVGVSRSDQPNETLLSYKNNKLIKNFKFYKFNINKDISKILSLIKKFKPEIIINYSAQGDVRHSWKNPSEWYETNSTAVINLTSKLIDLDFIKKYISISTPEVYGSSEKKIKESNFYNPSTPYAASKLSGDLHLQTMFKKYNFPVLFTRSSNVYGPYQQLYRIIPKTIINLKLGKKIDLHGYGKSKRDFIYIEDLNEAVFKIMNKGNIGEVYNIATNEKLITIYDLVKKICKIMNMNFDNSVNLVNENYGQDFTYNLNTNKIRKKFKWSEKIKLEIGIKKTISWINTNWSQINNMPHQYIHKK